VELLAPEISGWIFNYTNSYTAALYLYAFMAATSAGVISCVRSPVLKTLNPTVFD
jgi:hypothetical protein